VVLALHALTAGAAGLAQDGSATVTVTASQHLVTIPVDAGGVNVAVWDDHLTDAGNAALLQAAGLTRWRYPGGSTADMYLWQSNSCSNGMYTSPKVNIDGLMAMAAAAGAKPLITVNYGSSTASDAAAWVAYAKSRNYGISCWEIGNEVYGNGYYGADWEVDTHADHSPTAYATACLAYIQAMKSADPAIKVGVVVTMPGNWPDQAGTGSAPGGNGLENWNDTVLSRCGGQIDFVSAHWYAQAPGQENDHTLLTTQVGLIGGMAQALRAKINARCGAHAPEVQIQVTETNSVYQDPGKQTLGVVNALFLARDYLEWLANGAASVSWWSVRDAAYLGGNSSAALAGSGMLSNGASQEPPVNTPYWSYYGAQLLRTFAGGGDALVAADSTQANLVSYAALRADGSLALLLANLDGANACTATVALSGFAPAPTATVYRSTPMPGITSSSQGGIAAAFAISCPPFSLSVVVLSPAAVGGSGSGSGSGGGSGSPGGGAGASPPAITSPLRVSATVGTAFSYVITATGAAPLTFTTGTLPSGLSLAGATISGVPAAGSAGTSAVTLVVSDALGSASATLTLGIVAAGGGPAPASSPAGGGGGGGGGCGLGAGVAALALSLGAAASLGAARSRSPPRRLARTGARRA
jgi:Putative Ig domain